MPARKFLIMFGFMIALLWGGNKLKHAATRLKYENFNEKVVVNVTNLPICGRSNIIGVTYENKSYNLAINKNDCIQARYGIGDEIATIYNSKLDELNPKDFRGVYRLYMIYMFLVAIGFVFYIFLSKYKSSRNTINYD